MTRHGFLCGFVQTFFEIHDPSQTDGIGPDLGPQYRSMIFYMDEKQKSEAEEVIELLRSKGHRVNTRLRPAEKFWEQKAIISTITINGRRTLLSYTRKKILN